MAETSPISQFGGGAEGQSPSRDCLHTELMLADVLDGALSSEEQAAFDRHISTCAACAAMLADARRGVAWLEMLRPFQPIPPADLVSRILAETSVRAAADAEAARQQERAAIANASLMGAPLPSTPTATTPGRVLPFRTRLAAHIGPNLGALLQTRNAMTAAMAFFSITLTLNLLGVHVTALRARDLTPASLRRNASETNARIVRYYESLRVVYELESRVHDIQHANDTDPEPARTLTEPTPNNTAKPDTTTTPDRKKDAPEPDHKGRSSKEGSSSPAPGATSRDLGSPAAAHEPASATRSPGSARPTPPSLTPGPILPVSFQLPASHVRKGVSA